MRDPARPHRARLSPCPVTVVRPPVLRSDDAARGFGPWRHCRRDGRGPRRRRARMRGRRFPRLRRRRRADPALGRRRNRRRAPAARRSRGARRTRGRSVRRSRRTERDDRSRSCRDRAASGPAARRMDAVRARPGHGRRRRADPARTAPLRFRLRHRARGDHPARRPTPPRLLGPAATGPGPSHASPNGAIGPRAPPVPAR